MQHRLNILILFLLLTSCGGSKLVAVKDIKNIRAQIDQDTNLTQVSYNLIAGVDIAQNKSGTLIIWQKDGIILKIEQQLYSDSNYRRSIVYFNKQVPVLLINKVEETVTINPINGDKEEHTIFTIRENYILDWENNIIVKRINGASSKNKLEFCRPCFEKIINLAQDKMVDTR